MTHLVAADDRHFAWLLGETGGTGEFRIPPGGVEEFDILLLVRGFADLLRRQGCHAHWLIVAGDEIVGLCGLKRAPVAGRAEIGYGIAASRRGRSHATKAVALALNPIADLGVTTLTAETTAGNSGSEIVLERNGFARAGWRDDPEDGRLTLWERRLAATVTSACRA